MTVALQYTSDEDVHINRALLFKAISNIFFVPYEFESMVSTGLDM